jgi:hypothetical protein
MAKIRGFCHWCQAAHILTSSSHFDSEAAVVIHSVHAIWGLIEVAEIEQMLGDELLGHFTCVDKIIHGTQGADGNMFDAAHPIHQADIEKIEFVYALVSSGLDGDAGCGAVVNGGDDPSLGQQINGCFVR